MTDWANFDVLATKTLLLAAASYFEKKMCESILDACRASGSPESHIYFLDKQALSRKYHTMFDWDKQTLNKFLGLFGEPFKSDANNFLKANSLQQSVQDFIFINDQRNKMVHSNFASYNIDNVLEEIWVKFESANQFSEWFSIYLHEKWDRKDKK